MFRKVSTKHAKAKKPLRSRRTSDDDDDGSNHREDRPVDDAGNDAQAHRYSRNASTIGDGASAIGTEAQAVQSVGSGAAGDDSNDSLLQTIAATKRKRKLLTDLQYKRGTDASQLLVPRNQPGVMSTSSRVTEAVPGIGNAAAAAAMNMDVDTTAKEEEPTTVLEKKHRQAMQEYVRQNLLVKQVQASSAATATADANDSLPDATEIWMSTTVPSDDAAAPGSTVPSATDLFAELATQANALQQHHGVAAENEAASTAVIATAAASDSSASTSTSVMLHGTGIVEVVLPTIARAQQTTELVEAAENKKKQQQYQSYRNRSKRQRPDGDGDQGSTAGATSTSLSRPIVHKLPSRPSAQMGAVPNRFRTYQPPPDGDIKVTTTHDTGAVGATNAEAMHPPRGSDSVDDASRPGFAGFQRKGHHHQHHSTSTAAPASNSSSSSSQHPHPHQNRQHPQQQQRASDHVVYKKFVTHQQQLPNKKW